MLWAWATGMYNTQTTSAATSAMRKCSRPGDPGLPDPLRPGASLRGPPERSHVIARTNWLHLPGGAISQPLRFGQRHGAAGGPATAGIPPAGRGGQGGAAVRRSSDLGSEQGRVLFAGVLEGGKVGGGGGGGGLLKEGCKAPAQQVPTVNGNGSPALPTGPQDP